MYNRLATEEELDPYAADEEELRQIIAGTAPAPAPATDWKSALQATKPGWMLQAQQAAAVSPESGEAGPLEGYTFYDPTQTEVGQQYQRYSPTGEYLGAGQFKKPGSFLDLALQAGQDLGPFVQAIPGVGQVFQALNAIGALKSGNVAQGIASLAGAGQGLGLGDFSTIGNVARAAAAIENKDPLGLLTAGMNLTGAKDVGGFTTKEITAANAVVQGLQTGNYGQALSGAGQLTGNPNVAVAGAAVAFYNAAQAGNPAAMLKAGEALNTAINNAQNQAAIERAYQDPTRAEDVLQGITKPEVVQASADAAQNAQDFQAALLEALQKPAQVYDADKLLLASADPKQLAEILRGVNTPGDTQELIKQIQRQAINLQAEQDPRMRSLMQSELQRQINSLTAQGPVIYDIKAGTSPASSGTVRTGTSTATPGGMSFNFADPVAERMSTGLITADEGRSLGSATTSEQATSTRPRVGVSGEANVYPVGMGERGSGWISGPTAAFMANDLMDKLAYDRTLTAEEREFFTDQLRQASMNPDIVAQAPRLAGYNPYISDTSRQREGTTTASTNAPSDVTKLPPFVTTAQRLPNLAAIDALIDTIQGSSVDPVTGMVIPGGILDQEAAATATPTSIRELSDIVRLGATPEYLEGTIINPSTPIVTDPITGDVIRLGDVIPLDTPIPTEAPAQAPAPAQQNVIDLAPTAPTVAAPAQDLSAIQQAINQVVYGGTGEESVKRAPVAPATGTILSTDPTQGTALVVDPNGNTKVVDVAPDSKPGDKVDLAAAPAQDLSRPVATDPTTGEVIRLGDVVPSAPSSAPAPSTTETRTQAPAPSQATITTAAPSPAPSTTETKTEAPAPAPTATETKTEAPAPAETKTEVKAPSPAPTITETKTEAPAPAEIKTEAPAPTTTETKTEAPAPAPVTTEAKTEAPAPAPTTTEIKTEAPAPAPTATETKTEAPAPTTTETKTEAPAPAPPAQPPALPPSQPPAQPPAPPPARPPAPTPAPPPGKAPPPEGDLPPVTEEELREIVAGPPPVTAPPPPAPTPAPPAPTPAPPAPTPAVKPPAVKPPSPPPSPAAQLAQIPGMTPELAKFIQELMQTEEADLLQLTTALKEEREKKREGVREKLKSRKA